MIAREGIRARIDNSNERLSKKIREAQIKKIPYQVIIGDEEMNSKNIPATRQMQIPKGLTALTWQELRFRCGAGTGGTGKPGGDAEQDAGREVPEEAGFRENSVRR